VSALDSVAVPNWVKFDDTNNQLTADIPAHDRDTEYAFKIFTTVSNQTSPFTNQITLGVLDTSKGKISRI